MRKFLRWTAIAVGIVIILVGALFFYIFGGAIYRRIFVFPAEAKAWEQIRSHRQEVTLDDGWPEFRGCLHSHSELSHDSMVPFPEVLEAAKKADIQFLFMSDHCTDNKADYSLQWKGLHDGVLFVRGFEMDYGFMPWGIPDGTVLQRDKPPKELAKEIGQLGGVLFFAHSEEEREWDLPELNGMEIYNIHTDSKDEDLEDFIPDILVSIGSYGDQTIRLFYERQTAILAKWDALNSSRKIVGISANDCHQNLGYRGFYTGDDTLVVRTTASNDAEDFVGEYNLNFLTRPLLRMFCDAPLEPGKQVFRVDIDRYERGLRYVNSHILAKELTEASLIEGLRAGRVFIAFDMIADARGFVYFAEGNGVRAVMGEALPLGSGVTLKSESPQEVRFSVVRDGNPVHQEVGRKLEFPVKEPGKYRLEAELNIRGTWTPWIYTNPVAVENAAAATPAIGTPVAENRG